MINVRNLTTKTDKEFLQESYNAAAAAIVVGNAPLAAYWVEHGLSFIDSCRHEQWEKQLQEMLNGDGVSFNPKGILNGKIVHKGGAS